MLSCYVNGASTFYRLKSVFLPRKRNPMAFSFQNSVTFQFPPSKEAVSMKGWRITIFFASTRLQVPLNGNVFYETGINLIPSSIQNVTNPKYPLIPFNGITSIPFRPLYILHHFIHHFHYFSFPHILFSLQFSSVFFHFLCMHPKLIPCAHLLVPFLWHHSFNVHFNFSIKKSIQKR